MPGDAERGRNLINWARCHMPVTCELEEEVTKSGIFRGQTIAVCSHLEAKTGVLIEALAASGAKVIFTGSDPQTTQDDVVAALQNVPNTYGQAAHGIEGEETREMRLRLLERQPTILIDDGAEFLSVVMQEGTENLAEIIGGCEQTATGVSRIGQFESRLPFPVLRVNDTPMKRLFDNVVGTGESAVGSLLTTLNLQLAGRTVVIAGYGHCGRGVAGRMRAWGSRVIVTEIDPRKALEAQAAGFEVMPMAAAASRGSLFVTATGAQHVITMDHVQEMPNDAVLANVGHAADEIAVGDLREAALRTDYPRDGVERFTFQNGRAVMLICEGHPVNLAAPSAMGHAVEVIDLTLSLQLMGARYLVEHKGELTGGLHDFPEELDCELAHRRLRSLGITIDSQDKSD